MLEPCGAEIGGRRAETCGVGAKDLKSEHGGIRLHVYGWSGGVRPPNDLSKFELIGVKLASLSLIQVLL